MADLDTSPRRHSYALLICRPCNSDIDWDSPESVSSNVMPFGSMQARGRWARAHTDATGHDSWWVYDMNNPPAQEPVDIIVGEPLGY